MAHSNTVHFEKVERAIAKLKSLHDGDRGVIDVIGCGQSAVPALRALLFERETSGIYQPRRHAVEALAGLGSYDVLRDFLASPLTITAPIERIGEDAVINAAALALSRLQKDWVFRALLDVAAQRMLSGVVSALGTFTRPEAIPYLIDALAEDDCRPAAEAALIKLGAIARPALLEVALKRKGSGESSARQRRSTLKLLQVIGFD